jgi:hypothetical protein
MARAWIDFRDAYGAVWGVRVAERLNVAARRHGWPVLFAWRGLRVAAPHDTAYLPDRLPDGLPSEPGSALPPSSGARHGAAPPDPDAALRRLDPELQRRVRREFHALLRRFVSAPWIAAREAAAAGSGENASPSDE